MSTKGKHHNKRWLISKLKTSGSKRERIISADYSDTRNSKRETDLEYLPKHESIDKSSRFFNGKINYGLLLRFLRGKVGNDWKTVHREIMQRIPTNLLEYKDCVYFFVSDIVEKHDEKLWDRRSQKYLRSPNDNFSNSHEAKEFYVDPDTGLLLETLTSDTI